LLAIVFSCNFFFGFFILQGNLGVPASIFWQGLLAFRRCCSWLILGYLGLLAV